MKILCRTLFDCSQTKTTGHFRLSQLPFVDGAGKTIRNLNDWTYSRNQQRNFETIMQMISLRAQPEITQSPTELNGTWEFEFAVEQAGVYSRDGTLDSTAGLLVECEGTPMIVGLGEKQPLDPVLITQGQQQNIWFETVNKSLEHTDG